MDYCTQGKNVRNMAKELVVDFMKARIECRPLSEGLTQAEIFRACGLDWGNKEKATSTNQQYWVVALLRELEEENIIKRDPCSKKWRMQE